MRLNHIALGIQRVGELNDFYKNILGFHRERQFSIDALLAEKLFGLTVPAEVFLYKKEDVYIELFLSTEKTIHGFAHVCIDVADCESLVQRSKDAGYPVIRVERELKPDLIFIQDQAGNAFEIKKAGS